MKSRPNRVRFSEILHLNLATAGTRYHQGWYVAGKKTEHHCCCPLQDACPTPTARKSWRLRSVGHQARPHLYDMLCLCHMFGADHGAHLKAASRSFPPRSQRCCDAVMLCEGYAADTSAFPKKMKGDYCWWITPWKTLELWRAFSLTHSISFYVQNPFIITRLWFSKVSKYA